MIVFVYDRTFEGLLTVVFDAYFRKCFPEVLVAPGEPLPLFCTETVEVFTDSEKAERVWRALSTKLSHTALGMIWACWMSEQPEADMLLFRYIRKNVDAARSVEVNFADADVLAVAKLSKKVHQERLRVIQFIRFQKAADGTFFGAMEPLYNVFPLAIEHFVDRFGSQPWVVYDIKRKYGFYWDKQRVQEIRFDGEQEHLITGLLTDELMDVDEKLFQRLWRQYYRSMTIKERINPKLHRQNLPARFWKYLTEKKKDD